MQLGITVNDVIMGDFIRLVEDQAAGGYKYGHQFLCALGAFSVPWW
jgi:hypothetical protein